ncbi:MAG: hypothetical protein H0W93_08275, partial [Gammaproteobacteria bacterium]|nr:hypothetical protein [Gammaproteobacteria bacterium]
MTAWVRIVLVALSAMLIVSCGGGGGGTLAGGGIGGTGISNGTVTAFGSIFVNGVEFDTSQAAFTRGGQPATEADFNVGEVVTVMGSFDENGRTGVAQQVMYESVVNGVVTTVPALDDGEIEVLGQPVIITPATVLGNFDSATELLPGNVLEISGFVNADNSITATRIFRTETLFIPGVSSTEIRGFISGLDETALTFEIGDLTVQFSAPQLLEGNLANGVLVDIESDVDLVGGELIANVVQVIDDSLGAATGEDVDLESPITAFTSPTDFAVGGQPVTTTPATRYEDGAPSDLAQGILVEVEGVVGADGVLVAEDMGFQLPSEIFEVGGTVFAVDPLAGTVTVTSGVDGQLNTVSVGDDTAFVDDSDVALRPFGLADVRTGDALNGTAFRRGDTLIAIRIEREESVADIDD